MLTKKDVDDLEDIGRHTVGAAFLWVGAFSVEGKNDMGYRIWYRTGTLPAYTIIEPNYLRDWQEERAERRAEEIEENRSRFDVIELAQQFDQVGVAQDPGQEQGADREPDDEPCQ